MRNLTEKEAEDFLEKHGFKVVQRLFIETLEDLKIKKEVSILLSQNYFLFL